jgi:hypothetical protein
MRYPLLLTCTGLLGVLAQTANADQQFHVAVNGDDRASGSVEQPLATLEGAREMVRRARSSQATPEPIEIVVHAGRYELSNTFALTGEDSGTADAPIHYRAEGTVVLSGGITMPQPHFSPEPNQIQRFPAQAREHLVCWDLKRMGLEEASKRYPRSLGSTMAPASLQLIYGNQPLAIASWPQRGWALAKKVDGSKGAWQLPSGIPAWNESAMMVHGFWESDASDAFLPAIVQRSGARTTFRLATPPTETLAESRCRFENIASELDQAGEWYLDESTNTIYHWPLTQDFSQIVATKLETAVSFYDVQYLHFEGFTIEASRVMGLEIAGGEHVTIENCVLRHLGNVGVNVYYGLDHTIRGCKIHHCGSSAIRVEGGDRSDWTPANHLISHNILHDFGTLYMARRAGVDVHGVGICVRNNQIHHGPDIGIQLRGNELVVERNEIHDVCQETDDTGAIYLGHNPTYRGNVIRHNFVHDIGNYASANELRRTGIMAIYLDDFASGTTVTGNVLRNTVRGIAIGGGRDNVIEYNVILQALAGIQIDSRGTTWAADQVKPDDASLKSLVRKTLEENPELATRYSALANWGKDEPELPKGNSIRFNAVDGIAAVDLFDGLTDQLVAVEHNENHVDKIFVNAKGNNFTLLKPYDERFPSIPFSQIGATDGNTGYFVARTQSTK